MSASDMSVRVCLCDMSVCVCVSDMSVSVCVCFFFFAYHCTCVQAKIAAVIVQRAATATLLWARC